MRAEDQLIGTPNSTSSESDCQRDSTEQYEEKIHLQYGDLFKGLGTLGPEYTIQLKHNAKPYALNTPRNVPLPLRDKAKELTRMEEMGVITKVEGPSAWCAGMVVVPKKSTNAVRNCVDLKVGCERTFPCPPLMKL